MDVLNRFGFLIQLHFIPQLNFEEENGTIDNNRKEKGCVGSREGGGGSDQPSAWKFMILNKGKVWGGGGCCYGDDRGNCTSFVVAIYIMTQKGKYCGGVRGINYDS